MSRVAVLSMSQTEVSTERSGEVDDVESWASAVEVKDLLTSKQYGAHRTYCRY